MTNKEKAAINFLFEKVVSKRTREMIPEYENIFLFDDVSESVSNENEVKQILECMNLYERKKHLYYCVEACNRKTNNWLLHHSLLPVIVGTKLLQDESDRVICNKLLKIEDIFFGQNLLSCVFVDDLFLEKNIGLFLIIGEEYENLLSQIENNDRSSLFSYPFVHFELSYDSPDVKITFNYRALEFIFYGTNSIPFLQLTNRIRFDKYDGNLGKHYKEVLRNYYDPYRGGTLLELNCIRI